jgi:hypothetical protein
MAVEDLEHTTGGDHQAAPHWQSQLRRQTPWAETWMAEGKTDYTFLNPRRQLVGHPRPTPFSRSQHLQPWRSTSGFQR